MTTTQYIWDVESDNYLLEKDGSGTTTTTFTTEPTEFGRLVSQRVSVITRFFHFDDQDSTRQLTDQNQNVTDEIVYSAFGELISTLGSTINPFGFRGALGYYSNLESTLTYVRARYYDTLAGRWISSDPLGFDDGINSFLYVVNNTVNLVDPSGLSCAGCCCCTSGSVFTIRQLEYPFPEKLTNWWGHYFDAYTTLTFPPGMGDGLGCRLKWFECPNFLGSEGQKPNEWTMVTTDARIRLVDSDWDDYYDGKKGFECPGSTITLYLKDQPKDPFPSIRTVKFAIRTESESGCDCRLKSETYFFTQRLKAKPKVKFDQIGGRIKPDQWEKWELTSGISDAEDPKDCKHNNVPT